DLRPSPYAPMVDRPPGDAGHRATKPIVNATFLQPFAVYHLGHGLSIQAESESFHDWTHRKWTVPIYVGVAQVFANRDLPISVGFGPRVFIVSPRGNVLWGLR